MLSILWLCRPMKPEILFVIGIFVAMTVWFIGRLSRILSVVVAVSSLLCLILLVGAMAIIDTRFEAIALAPLSMTALIWWALLRILGLWTSIFIRVFCLALISSVAGAVSFRVYG